MARFNNAAPMTERWRNECVSIRSANPKQAADWLKYATQPGTYSLWLGKGLERVK